MKLSISSSRARTIAGLVMSAGLGPLLLALSGVWRVERRGRSSDGLWIIEPWTRGTEF